MLFQFMHLTFDLVHKTVNKVMQICGVITELSFSFEVVELALQYLQFLIKITFTLGIPQRK